jgi:uncharacterized protein (DUF342 family)
MEFIVSGKTVEKALSKGLKEYSLSLNDVEVEVLDFGERKLFLSRPVTIKLKTKGSENKSLHEREKQERLASVETSVETPDELLLESDLLRYINEIPSVQYAAKVDGTVEYGNEKFTVTDPKNDGSYAVIVVPSEIQLLVDGKEIKNTTIVTSKHQIQIKTDRKDSRRNFEIKVDQAAMSASIKVLYETGYEILIEDSAPEQRLHLSTVRKTIPVPKYTLEEISTHLKNKGIVYGIDWALLVRILIDGDGEWHDFAVGTPAISGDDGKLDLLIDCEGREHVKDVQSNIKKILSVKEGEVLAKIIPPKLGKAGTNVYGVTVLSAPGKEVKIRPGTGVEWMDESKTFVSTSTGRPAVRKGMLEVVPCHVINEDVHYADGGLQFLGDVIINGSVHEGVNIQAGGNVSINGYVYHSTIEAQGSVTITKQVVGGRIQAGASQVCFVQASRLMDELLQMWQGLMLAVNQLEGIQAFKQQDLLVRGLGHLVKLLIETKFKDIPLLVKRLQQHYEDNESLLKQPLQKALSSIQKSTLGFGPLQFRSKAEVEQEMAYWREAFDCLHEMNKWKENIEIGSAFNTKIEASGSVKVNDWGIENCFLIAGESVFVQGDPGTVRGGAIMANKMVKVNEIGTPAGAKTQVELPETGQFEALKIHFNTRVKKGMVEKEYKGNEDRLRTESSVG